MAYNKARCSWATHGHAVKTVTHCCASTTTTNGALPTIWMKFALYDDTKITELLNNEGIIRNRLKVGATIINAKLFLDIQKQHGSFDKLIWAYVDNKPIVGHWERAEDVPVTTSISDQISKDLKKMGFKFIGSTIIYSFMQAVGMVNDHLKGCRVYEDVLHANIS